jgi:hypothetical protein
MRHMAPFEIELDSGTGRAAVIHWKAKPIPVRQATGVWLHGFHGLLPDDPPLTRTVLMTQEGFCTYILSTNDRQLYG